MSRRGVVRAGALVLGLGALAGGAPATAAGAAPATDRTGVRPFSVHIPRRVLDDLGRRLSATRWPDPETVTDTSQGVPLELMRDVAQYWATRYDWRRFEAQLNSLPQFMTAIDGLDIHFIHVRSLHPNALPVLVTHGWPGSIVEQLKIIAPLVDPTAYGASASDAFHVIIPSIPGYGFSARPTTTGWGPDHVASAWVELMNRLGYGRFVVAGGDVGSVVNTAMARLAPPQLIGLHTSLPATVPVDIARAMQCGDSPPPGLSADERRAYLQLANQSAKHFAYSSEMHTRPQTLYGLADSPVAMAGWLLDHGDGDDQPAAAIVSALHGAQEYLTRDDVLDNLTVYWFTNTGISSARFYWENTISPVNAADLSIPAAVTVFPSELYQAPRSWAERAYHDLIYFHEADEGGHFAAWEQPLIYAAELRAGFRPLRPA
ncbi:epoxide hydrolase family protein [Krasilnikovia sp. MM14-A1004]|uniref:epoxide hydrolase family protein n=1 Tax=Krasilnikovia sp. MM14-A1004 TaxID=3373541 RepID=UPI00399CAF7A